jgi:Methyltransferase domain
MSRRAVFQHLYGLRWLLLFGYKITIATGYLFEPTRQFLRWLFLSREVGNFTYGLSERSTQYLASVLSVVVKRPYDEIFGYLSELEGDLELREHLEKHLRESKTFLLADPRMQFGRRAGWYAVVRALKPKVVVETGVDKGLGSCVLAAAVRRNIADGYYGRYLGTDINPQAGYFFTAPYDLVGSIIYGDSIESLKAFESKIDVFINDSDHSAEYEAREYETIVSSLSEGAVILGDNAHVSSKLQEFALTTGRQFLFFREEPIKHWYRGAGIGFAFGSDRNCFRSDAQNTLTVGESAGTRA